MPRSHARSARPLVAQIRPQGETHDPQRVRGPAATRNQVRAIGLRVDALADGSLRLSVAGARGWARRVRTQGELARAVSEAFREAQIASYARWRGESYDLDQLAPVWPDDPDPLVAAAPEVRSSRRAGRSDVHDPMEWTPLDDGSWRSPSGRVFGANTSAVRRVQAKRAQRDSG
jgi:hypothetical protein